MFFYESLYAEPFARYTPVVAATPEGSEIVDDWEIFWGLAKRLNLQLVYDGVPLDMTAEPTTDALLAVVARHAPVSFEELKSFELGNIFDDDPPYVEPADPACTDQIGSASGRDRVCQYV